jgi:hypothetical protein
VLPNGTAIFSVDATGTGPLTYEWRKNGTPIPGATSATLQITPVTTNDQGTYTVAVTNPAGTVISSGANLSFLGLR